MNNIHRVNLSSGIIGMLVTSPKRALSQCLREASANGEELVFVLPDHQNVFQLLINLLILALTLLLWCPAPGYLVITRPRSIAPSTAGPAHEPPPAKMSSTECSKCGKSYEGDLRGQYCEVCGNRL